MRRYGGFFLSPSTVLAVSQNKVGHDAHNGHGEEKSRENSRHSIDKRKFRPAAPASGVSMPSFPLAVAFAASIVAVIPAKAGIQRLPSGAQRRIL
ncbi:MAG: hypothetical protein LBI87_07175 [Candidatus Accumulibacter sp.]|nr:hypothetical protein [Accumulibacter sp.]